MLKAACEVTVHSTFCGPLHDFFTIIVVFYTCTARFWQHRWQSWGNIGTSRGWNSTSSSLDGPGQGSSRSQTQIQIQIQKKTVVDETSTSSNLGRPGQSWSRSQIIILPSDYPCERESVEEVDGEDEEDEAAAHPQQSPSHPHVTHMDLPKTLQHDWQQQ